MTQPTNRPRKPRADAGVPRGPYKDHRPQLSVRLDCDVAVALQAHQKGTEQTRNAFINEALRSYLKEQSA